MVVSIRVMAETMVAASAATVEARRARGVRRVMAENFMVTVGRVVCLVGVDGWMCGWSEDDFELTGEALTGGYIYVMDGQQLNGTP